MADNEELGIYSRHPVRTAGIAMLIGTAVGASMMAAKQQRDKGWLQKIIEDWTS